MLHQHLADKLGEEAVFAVMAEHNLNSYNTRCNDREIDRLKRATWVHGIVGGILKGGECIEYQWEFSAQYVWVSNYCRKWSAVMTFAKVSIERD